MYGCFVKGPAAAPHSGRMARERRSYKSIGKRLGKAVLYKQNAPISPICCAEVFLIKTI